MKKKYPLLKQGTQILYVPDHANGDENHPSVEAGFVTSMKPGSDMVFCRYWIARHRPRQLRTKANSEGTYMRNIVVKDTVPQKQVDQKIAEILEQVVPWNPRERW